MRLDQNPVYRKVIVPWWDSEITCLIVILFMVLFILFGGMGISVAHETVDYRPFIWVPILIVVLSGGVILSITIRLVKRHLSFKNKQ